MSRRTIVIAVSAVCLLAVVAGLLAWFLVDDPPRAAVVRGDRTSAVYAPIAARTQDPAPLTVAEVFAAGQVRSGKVVLNRGETGSPGECAEAVWGDTVTGAVAGCTQALRAGYRTPDGRVAGQFVIFNLADAAAADRLVDALAGRTGGFARLAPGVPDDFDAARSRAHARALGHFVAVSWAAPLIGGPEVDLTRHLVALDTLGQAATARVVRAT
ncbi:hypothetical protein DP939_11410 [Spongiactinospora rosea]|uniref:Uncharacterized protein n=1 Tax=Spongiactinospora rosea TaxID=2248750 RepID=A0A366M2C4_9ACTN|nr:hypothetical protein [Spongiactinospora rosea]RBQ20388.1 hypothetical protein DP939_11410 [Spongiactinospora rosea]